MTHCYNCGHAGTFVLLVQFALAVPGPDARVPDRSDPDDCGVSDRDAPARGSRDRGDALRDSPGRADGRDGPEAHYEGATRRGDGPRRANRSHHRVSLQGDGPRRRRFDRDGRLEPGDLPTGGDLSLAVQCPACDSTDVGVAAADLLARYGSSTTS